MKHPRLLKRIGLSAALTLIVLAGLSARADYQSTVLSQSPAGYWRLNETLQPQNITGAKNFGSLGISAIGSYNGFPLRALSGPFAGSTAVGLDGVAQSVTTPWQAGLNSTAFSVELWVNPDQVPKFAYIASSVHLAAAAPGRSGWYLAQDDGSTFMLGSAFVVRMFYQNAANPAITLSAPVTVAGVWYHLVLTYDGTTATLYTNGVVAQSGAPLGYVGNTDAQSSFGVRSDNGFFWPGKEAEVAMYSTALSAGQVSTHYTTGNTTPGSYQATVLADSPVLYYRFQEAIDPPAVNIGTLGSAGNGFYIFDAKAGVNGPITPTYSGFDAANKAAAFDAGGGVVRIPPLNLNTNTVTISCWINATNSPNPQPIGAGLVLCSSGVNASGLTCDQINGGLGLGYIWNGNNDSWSPTADSGLPPLPDSEWAYAALVIKPSEAILYICHSNNFASFTSATNFIPINHQNQAFAQATLVGAASGFTNRNFNGAVDEVTIFNRALSAGELYNQYAAAVSGVPPRIFVDLQGPVGSVAAGDAIVLTVDAGGSAPLTYYWRKGGGTIATTTSGVFTIANSTLADSGNYDVIVSNSVSVVGSQVVAVSVVTPSAPNVTELVGFNNRTLYVGATLKLAVAATGGGLKYQWYKNSSPIASATGSAYIVPSVTNSHAGNYSVYITNSVAPPYSNGPVVITIPVMASNSYEGMVITSGPEAWWRLDETAGSTILIDGMGRHDGVYTNLLGDNPPVALGVPGALVGDPNTGASFSGNQGLGVIPYSTAFSPAKFTIEGWVRTTVTDDNNLCPFSSTYGSGGHYWRTSPVPEWSPFSITGARAPLLDNGQTNAVVVPNQWTHLVMCYDSSIAGFPWIYAINGFRATTSWSGIGPNTEGPFIIGGAGVSATTLAQFFWKGQVDEVAIYQRVLSNAEILAHYTARGVEILPPSFGVPLLSQTVTTGKNINFSTMVFGTSPALYWYKGTPGATAPVATGTNGITIYPTALTDTGNYSLVASNQAGMATNTASLTVIPAVGYAYVTNNLVLHLRFDSDTTDSSGRGNNGTPSSSPAPAFVPGIIGAQALQYTTTSVTNNGTNIAFGSASYVALGTEGSGPPTDLQFGASTSFSVSLWAKFPTNALPGDLPFIGTATNSANNPGWVLAPSYHTGAWQWDLNDGTNNIDVNGPANSINDGAWHNFVLTVNRGGSVADTYLDGVRVASTSITTLGDIDRSGTNDVYNYWPIAIGQDPTGTYPQITGASANDFETWFPPNTATLDDVGVWRRALTPLEVAQINSAGATGGRSFDTIGLSIARSGSDLILSYPTGTLLQSSNVNSGAVWAPVLGASPPTFTVTPTGSAKFYRVSVP